MEIPSKNQAAEMMRTALRVRKREQEILEKLQDPHRRAHINNLSTAIEQIEGELKTMPKMNYNRLDAPPLVTTTDEEQLNQVRMRCLRHQKGQPTPPVTPPEAEHRAKPLKDLDKKPWAMPKVDPTLVKDPYLRAQGLHRNNLSLRSPDMNHRFATKKFQGKDVDFDFEGFQASHGR